MKESNRMNMRLLSISRIEFGVNLTSVEYSLQAIFYIGIVNDVNSAGPH